MQADAEQEHGKTNQDCSELAATKHHLYLPKTVRIMAW
jgi:hypothetical protein